MNDNALAVRNRDVLRSILLKKQQIDERHRTTAFVRAVEYELARLRNQICDVLKPMFGAETPRVVIDLLERGSFEADLCLKIPQLLSKYGPALYSREIVPSLALSLTNSDLYRNGTLVHIEAKHIYLNITLSPRYLLQSLRQIIDLGFRYGCSDTLTNERVAVDYSSPNAAKRLHAGHIRSTIIGDVLANLYAAAGAVVYRINHINDIGTFAQLLEGYRRWSGALSASPDSYEGVVELYEIWRRLERLATRLREGGELSQEDDETWSRYLGNGASRAERLQQFDEFVEAAARRARLLESGAPDEMKIWERMIDSSLLEFQRFYDLLQIEHDMTINESFYVSIGHELVNEGLRTGACIHFTQDRAAQEVDQIRSLASSHQITTNVEERLIAGVLRDIDAVVVPLSKHDRFVIQRSDGLTIYATRDLAALKFRNETLEATKVVYVVGIEQRYHFEQLFEAAELMKLAPRQALSHVYFGFYVDAKTKKRLSSREGAKSVVDLIQKAADYFLEKWLRDSGLSESACQTAARQLAIGSIVFNDIRRDLRSSVELSDISETVFEEFGRSGGAYVMYTACRASSVLSKYGAAVPQTLELEDSVLEPIEIELIKTLLRFPEVVQVAAQNSSASAVVNALLDISRLYNSFYGSLPILGGGLASAHRIMLTSAVDTALRSGLSICGIECPDRI